MLNDTNKGQGDVMVIEKKIDYMKLYLEKNNLNIYFPKHFNKWQKLNDTPY